jgi:hypothetical protein
VPIAGLDERRVIQPEVDEKVGIRHVFAFIPFRRARGQPHPVKGADRLPLA